MNRILIIRGGAIGDFIVTLPALKALRERFPDAAVEILGYKHIAALAENRFYANAVRSIEYAPLSGFFARGGQLDPELCSYFASFDLVISYLFDPDGIFETNLRRTGVNEILCGPAKIQTGMPATLQLVAPLEGLQIKVTDYAPKLFPSADDREFARNFLKGFPGPVFAIHAGSGSHQKNWPLDNWIDLGNRLLGRGARLLVVSGEADQAQFGILEKQWRDRSVRFAVNLPLTQLAAILADCCFVGHDSGISHLAAAGGAKCILLFGRTDPGVWAPPGDNVRVIRAPEGDLSRVSPEAVLSAMWEQPWE